jgi:hypothetical protein
MVGPGFKSFAFLCCCTLFLFVIKIVHFLRDGERIDPPWNCSLTISCILFLLRRLFDNFFFLLFFFLLLFFLLLFFLLLWSSISTHLLRPCYSPTALRVDYPSRMRQYMNDRQSHKGHPRCYTKNFSNEVMIYRAWRPHAVP